MYNNLTQQTPYIPYSYGVTQQYPRIVSQELQNTIPQQSTQSPYTPMPMMQNYIKGRPVVSIDEARASQIDLDGSLYVFPDLGNKKIYTKQINIDGTATFNVFTLTPETAPVEENTLQMYVTKDELN